MIKTHTQTTDTFGDKVIVKLMIVYSFVGTVVPSTIGAIYLHMQYV